VAISHSALFTTNGELAIVRGILSPTPDRNATHPDRINGFALFHVHVGTLVRAVAHWTIAQ